MIPGAKPREGVSPRFTELTVTLKNSLLQSSTIKIRVYGGDHRHQHNVAEQDFKEQVDACSNFTIMKAVCHVSESLSLQTG